jgi:hypothetical protein
MSVHPPAPRTPAAGLLTRSDIPRRQWNRGMEADRLQDLLHADPGRSHNVTINPTKKSWASIEPGASFIRYCHADRPPSAH